MVFREWRSIGGEDRLVEGWMEGSPAARELKLIGTVTDDPGDFERSCSSGSKFGAWDVELDIVSF